MERRTTAVPLSVVSRHRVSRIVPSSSCVRSCDVAGGWGGNRHPILPDSIVRRRRAVCRRVHWNSEARVAHCPIVIRIGVWLQTPPVWSLRNGPSRWRSKDRESSAWVVGDAIAGVENGLEPGLGKFRNLGAIFAKPLCRAASGHKPELTHAGQTKRLDLQGSHRRFGPRGEPGERAERAGAPSADFKTLQSKAEAAQLGVNVPAIEPERVADLAANLKQGAALAQRRLESVQGVADAVDQGAGAAEVEGARGAAVAIAEAIVGAERFAVAAAPSGIDASLLGEELGPSGQEDRADGSVGPQGGRAAGHWVLPHHGQNPLPVVAGVLAKISVQFTHGRAPPETWQKDERRTVGPQSLGFPIHARSWRPEEEVGPEWGVLPIHLGA